MDLTIVLGVAGVVGAITSVVVAILPQVRDWWLDRVNRPLRVDVIPHSRRFNRAFGLRIQIRVRNRLSVAIPVRIAANVNCVLEDGEMRGRFFEVPPRISLFPSNEPAQSFLLPGKDQRDVEIELAVRPGIFEGSDSFPISVTAFRFRSQVVRIGPFEYTIDPGAE